MKLSRLSFCSILLLAGLTACQSGGSDELVFSYGVDVQAPEEEAVVMLSSDDFEWDLFNNGDVLFSYTEDFVVEDEGDSVHISNDRMDISISTVTEEEVLGSNAPERSDYWREFAKKENEWMAMEAYSSDVNGFSVTDLFLLEEIYSTLSIL